VIFHSYVNLPEGILCGCVIATFDYKRVKETSLHMGK
jgi:hypothetical protein